VAVDPVAPSTILAGTAGGLFKSNDRGASSSGSLLASSIYSLVFSPQTPSTIFGAGFDSSYYYPYPSSVYKSTDGGATWSSNSTSTRIYPGTPTIDPTNPSILYAGSAGAAYGAIGDGGVYKSVDSGSTWRLASSDLKEAVYAVAIDPRNPSTLYAANYRGSFEAQTGAPIGLSSTSD